MIIRAIDNILQEGNAPIHLAILRDNDEDRTLIIEELLRHGANLNLQRQSVRLYFRIQITKYSGSVEYIKTGQIMVKTTAML